MTHRVHPYIFRLGTTTTWKSRWFNQKRFKEYLREDVLLREWLLKKLRATHIESIEIERAPNVLTVIIKTARPGILIGRGGEGIEKLKKEIEVFIAKLWRRLDKPLEKRETKLTVEDVHSPDTHAAIVGEMIAEALEKRTPFRRVLKQMVEKVAGNREVKGVKIMIKGRLDGGEIARTEWLKKGRIPLQTIRADIDYAGKTAYTTYGTVGIKVWIYKGEVFAKTQNT
jgi:small subunit ribosomal protein S3